MPQSEPYKPTAQDLEEVKATARYLVGTANVLGLRVTISHEPIPDTPLAQGNYRPVIDVYPAHAMPTGDNTAVFVSDQT